MEGMSVDVLFVFVSFLSNCNIVNECPLAYSYLHGNYNTF